MVRVTATTVTFWLVDPQSGRPREGDTLRIEDRGPEGIELTAVRASEVVRAQLLPVPSTAASSPKELDTAPRTADASAPAPTGAAVTDPPAPGIPRPDAVWTAGGEEDAAKPSLPAAADAGTRRNDSSSQLAPRAVPPWPRISASLGPVLLLAPGGTKPALDLTLSPEWHASRSLGIRVLLAAPITAPSITATGGEAAVSTWLGGAAIDWQLSSNDDHWRGMLGGGAAAVLSHARGTATAPYIGSTTNAVTSLPFLGIGGSRGLGLPSVRLGVRGMLGVALPEVAIQFASRRVATWGLPVVGASSVVLDVDLW